MGLAMGVGKVVGRTLLGTAKAAGGMVGDAMKSPEQLRRENEIANAIKKARR